MLCRLGFEDGPRIAPRSRPCTSYRIWVMPRARCARRLSSSLNWRHGDVLEPLRAMSLSANFFELAGTPAWMGHAHLARGRTRRQSQRSGLDLRLLGAAFGTRPRHHRADHQSQWAAVHSYRCDAARVQHGDGRLDPADVRDHRAGCTGLEERRAPAFSLVVRLAPGVGRAQAGAAFQAMAQVLETAYPRDNGSFGGPPFVIPV